MNAQEMTRIWGPPLSEEVIAEQQRHEAAYQAKLREERDWGDYEPFTDRRVLAWVGRLVDMCWEFEKQLDDTGPVV